MDDNTILRLLATFGGISPFAEQFVPPRSAGPTAPSPQPSVTPAPPQPASGPEPQPPAPSDGKASLQQALALAFRDQMSNQFNRSAGFPPRLGNQQAAFR